MGDYTVKKFNGRSGLQEWVWFLVTVEANGQPSVIHVPCLLRNERVASVNLRLCPSSLSVAVCEMNILAWPEDLSPQPLKFHHHQFEHMWHPYARTEHIAKLRVKYIRMPHTHTRVSHSIVCTWLGLTLNFWRLSHKFWGREHTSKPSLSTVIICYVQRTYLDRYCKG